MGLKFPKTLWFSAKKEALLRGVSAQQIATEALQVYLEPVKRRKV